MNLGVLNVLAGDWKGGGSLTKRNTVLKLPIRDRWDKYEDVPVTTISKLEISSIENVKGGVSLGGAVVGAALLGPAGAIIGAASGKVQSDITFVAHFEDGRKFMATSSVENFRSIEATLFDRDNPRKEVEKEPTRLERLNRWAEKAANEAEAKRAEAKRAEAKMASQQNVDMKNDEISTPAATISITAMTVCFLAVILYCIGSSADPSAMNASVTNSQPAQVAGRTTSTSEAELARAVRDSENYDQYQAQFHAAARTYIESGRCTVDELAEFGGFVKSPSRSGNYFTYCGGSAEANKIYIRP